MAGRGESFTDLKGIYWIFSNIIWDVCVKDTPKSTFKRAYVRNRALQNTVPETLESSRVFQCETNPCENVDPVGNIRLEVTGGKEMKCAPLCRYADQLPIRARYVHADWVIAVRGVELNLCHTVVLGWLREGKTSKTRPGIIELNVRAIEDYPQLFQGLGEMPHPYKIRIKEKARPV
ncbi:hypothetical protein GQR58_008665 [Nymphon striatum]|nr:hypothetical protein GQR58_008665 [Nymphon striatum]